MRATCPTGHCVSVLRRVLLYLLSLHSFGFMNSRDISNQLWDLQHMKTHYFQWGQPTSDTIRNTGDLTLALQTTESSFAGWNNTTFELHVKLTQWELSTIVCFHGSLGIWRCNMYPENSWGCRIQTHGIIYSSPDNLPSTADFVSSPLHTVLQELRNKRRVTPAAGQEIRQDFQYEWASPVSVVFLLHLFILDPSPSKHHSTSCVCCI